MKLFDIIDLSTGRHHYVNPYTITEFNYYYNEANVKVYQIQLTNGTAITVPRKIWSRIKGKMQNC